MRYWLAIGVFLAAIAAAILLRPERGGGQLPGVPEAALAAMRAGRYLEATQLIRAHLKGLPDTSAETLVVLARAEAGWGDWPQVRQLLAGRAWLDTVDGGGGRELLGRSELARGDWSAAAADLGRYLDVAEGVDERARGLALVRRAQALQRAGQEAAALAAYDAGAKELAPVQDWVRWLAAGAAADAGDTAQVRARLAQLPPALERGRGWRLRVQAAERAHDSTAALAQALGAAATLPDAAGRAGAWQTAGRLRLARGDRTGARLAFDRGLRLAPGSAAAARALLALPPLNRDQRLRAGTALLRSGAAVAAAPPIRAYLASGRVPAERRVTLLFQLGRGLFAAGRYGDAIATLRAARRGASAGTAAQATFLIARAEYRAGRTAAARATLRRTVELYPRAGAAADALFLLGDLEQDAGQRRRAAADFRRAIALHAPPASAATLAEAYMRLAGMAYAAGDYAGAAATDEAYRRRFPTGEAYQQATYWAARAYARLGKAATARARLQELARRPSLSYYVVRATERLGTPLLAAAGPAPAGADPARDSVTRGVTRIDLLHELGLDGAAGEEASALEARLAGNDAALYDLAELLDARGFTARGIAIGWRLRQRAGAWNPRLLRIVYPFPYREDVLANARAQGLDPYLVAGLIHQESDFSASARSRVGAVGLMQLMPATARILARPLGIEEVTTDQLERPELNVRLGTAFAAELLRQAGGSVPGMLAAYNAGPARLDRWRRFREARDPELFAERIPFDETRHYVKVVQANARIYQALYPAGDDATSPG